METTLVKGLSVLSTLSLADQPLGVSALAEELALNKSNVHRLLNTLIALDYVEQIPSTKKYAPTLKAWELGSLVVGRHPLRRAAKPILREIFAATSRTAFVAALTGSELLYIDAIESATGFRSSTRLGMRTPVGFTAAGKILLAFQPEPEDLLDRAMAQAPERTDIDRAAVLAELPALRAQGYATSLSGWTPTHNSLAVAIPSQSGPPAAALGLSGVPNHLDLQDVGNLVETLADGAVRIAQNLL